MGFYFCVGGELKFCVQRNLLCGYGFVPRPSGPCTGRGFGVRHLSVARADLPRAGEREERRHRRKLKGAILIKLTTQMQSKLSKSSPQQTRKLRKCSHNLGSPVQSTAIMISSTRSHNATTIVSPRAIVILGRLLVSVA